MQYHSTRGSGPALGFADVALAGLAPDGGLYVPAQWPRFTPAQIAALADASYVDTAVTVCRPFIAGAFTDAELAGIFSRAYAGFSHAATVPLGQLDARHWLLELFHGPTLAFKDMAMQALGQVFEALLARTGRRLTVIGATSGDTGSAAINALAGKAGVEVFMLHPEGRVSDVQRRQMTTVMAPNIHNIAIAGTFDDCQALVKAMFNDTAFAARLPLSAVNSINWARLLFQIPYYFYGATRLGAPHRAIGFAVPTGNFGDVFAGYAAAQMGLPISRLVVATNENDILHRALSQGDYSVGQVAPTQSPSMDIQVSSNFERLLFDLYGRDGAATAAAMAGFETSKRLALPPEQQARAGLFTSERVDTAAMAATIHWAHSHCGEVLDPHSAIGLAAARRQPGAEPLVTLATAHPAKFPAAVQAACGVTPALPAHMADLHDRPERYDRLPHDLAAVEAFVLARSAHS